MRKLFTLILAMLFFMSADIEVSDISYSSELSYRGKNFVLNGAGVREMYFIDLYTLGLYVKTKSKDADVILQADEPQFMRLVCVSDLITDEKFNEAMVEGFFKATNGEPEKWKSEIEILKNAFSGEWNVNDEFTIYYEPTTGLELYKNGTLKATINKGLEFKSTVMKIWLGPDCVSNDLKSELLGND